VRREPPEPSTKRGGAAAETAAAGVKEARLGVSAMMAQAKILE